jgi:kexin
LCLESTHIVNPSDESWQKTFTGRPYSVKYGYGAIDAYKLIENAKTFIKTKSQTIIKVRADPKNISISDGGLPAETSVTVTPEMVEKVNTI